MGVAGLPSASVLSNPRYVVMDEFGRGGVVADHDEDRRRWLGGLLSHLSKGVFVVCVQCVQGCEQLCRESHRVQCRLRSGLGLFLGILVLMFSQRFRNTGRSSSDALSATGTLGIFSIPDSIASIREKSETVQGNSVPFVVPGPLQEERRRGEVYHG